MSATDPFLGEICAVSFNFAPVGWALCDGRLLAISQNAGLFSLIGSQYGGDGIQNFALPDLRGRAVIGTGQGPGLSDISLGQAVGAEAVGLNVNQLPPHTHDAVFSSEGARPPASGGSGSLTNPTGAIPANAMDANGTVLGCFAPASSASAGMAVVPVDGNVQVMATGGGQAVDIRGPGLGLTYIIALQGVYPSKDRA